VFQIIDIEIGVLCDLVSRDFLREVGYFNEAFKEQLPYSNKFAQKSTFKLDLGLRLSDRDFLWIQLLPRIDLLDLVLCSLCNVALIDGTSCPNGVQLQLGYLKSLSTLSYITNYIFEVVYLLSARNNLTWLEIYFSHKVKTISQVIFWQSDNDV
jgi:hypothetical protein